MSPELLTIDVVLHDEGHVTLCLAGEIDMSTAQDLREAALSALNQYGPNLHLDLSRVEFMDSTGLEVLISIRRWANREGGHFQLVDPGHAVLRVLEVSGLARLFEIYDEDSELADLA
jgi:anti-sigma B factor antagonist